ncbi:MAG: ATP-dependent helicase [Bacteroidota bacterium]|nr:ATP-dependent helicase [Bacteroidota bacterium]
MTKEKKAAPTTGNGSNNSGNKNKKKSFIPKKILRKILSEPTDNELLNGLNERQREAVTCDGPALVIAGAGTGKTRVLTYRVAYLIKKGIDPRLILLLTFTKKAAMEMLNRVYSIVKDDFGRHVSGGTFHSFCVNTLRQYANLLDLPEKFTVLDNPDSEDVIDKIRTDLGFHNQELDFPKKARIFEIISESRNKMISIREVVESKYTALKPMIPYIELISELCREYKKSHAMFDFDDLIEVMVEKLEGYPRFRRIITRKYKYVLIDEFQDTNRLQLELIRLIAPSGNNVLAVGDDFQSIYSFRGAEYRNMFDFPVLFPGCQIITLEQNYRSHPALLDYTNQIIEASPSGYKKKLWSAKTPGSKPLVVKFDTPEDEAVYIADEIKMLKETNVPTSEIAVLARVSHTTRYIEIELAARGIPYVIIGGRKFTERKHIKDIMGYLRISYNTRDEVAWHRVLKLIPGVGTTTAEKILLCLDDGNLLEHSPGKRYGESVRELGRVIRDISDDSLTIPRKIERIKQHYYPILEVTDKDPVIKKKDIDFFQQMSGDYDSIEKFLTDFVLDHTAENLTKGVGPVIDETEEPPVTISTIHSAKGLEWHSVFIPHAVEGIIPNSKATGSEEVEEERRVFYVACTRAKENLHITFPAYSPIGDAYTHFPSRFVEEINESKYLEINNIEV